MLPRSARLKRKSDFNRVYGKGRSYATDLVVMYVAPNRSESTRIGFSISSKVGKSVVRNRTRRLLREACRLLLPHVQQGFDIIVIAKKKAADASFAELYSAVRKLFRRAGLIRFVPDLQKHAEDHVSHGAAEESGAP